MKTVAVTGISGYIGRRVFEKLEAQHDVERVIGLDLKTPPFTSPKITFHERDIGEPFGDVFSDGKVTNAVHLAFVVRPTQDRLAARRINVDGARNFIDACRQASVKHALYLSSHSSYGPHPDNPVSITEDTPLRPLQSFQYSVDKGEADQMFRDFTERTPETSVSIVRACSVLGPNGVGSVSTGMFNKVMLRLAGYNPLFQFLHEDDLAELITALVVQQTPGVFNAAGDGPIRYKEVIAATGKRCVVLPALPLSAALALSWKLRLQDQSPPGGLEFIKYSIILSTEKVQKTNGFKFRHTTRDTLEAYLNAARV